MSDRGADQTRTVRPAGRPAARRGSSAPAEPGTVVTAALKVVESEGGDALTMRRVADEIGVSASSLYGYVANKEELVQLVLEQIMTEIPFPAGDLEWREMLRQWARGTLAVFRHHPGVAGLDLGRVPFGPALLSGAERILGTLRAAGLPDQVAAYAGDLGSLYVAAFAHELEVSPVPQSGEFADQAAQWLRSLPPDQFPNIVAVADVMVAGSGLDRFEWGLDVLIRGFASYLTDPPGPDGHWAGLPSR